jgi:hypothetical protein
MRLLEMKSADKRDRGLISRDESPLVNTRVMLEELFDLLEEYGPSWYTVEHHNRTAAVLRK